MKTLSKKITKQAASMQSKTHGFTMVEIMVAMVVGLILTAGTIQVFVGNKKTYQTTEASSRLQENARFAINLLTKDLRMTGYTGCFSGSLGAIENILNDTTNYGWDISKVLEGYDWDAGTTWNPALTGSISNVVAGTDVITLRRMDSAGIGLTDPYNDSAQMFIDSDVNNIEEGEILMVTDCTQGSIFQATDVVTPATPGANINITHSNAGTYTPGNNTPLLGNTYGADAEIARLVSVVYYIRNNSYGNPSLYRSSLGIAAGATAALEANELVENVENMQILYGEDSDDDQVANFYGTAGDVTMGDVVSIRITLTLRTDDNISMSSQTHTTAGGTDNRQRRTFTTTIGIRNRLN